MQEILLPNSKAEDLLMKNVLSRYQKNQTVGEASSIRKVLSVPSYHSHDKKAVNTSIHS